MPLIRTIASLPLLWSYVTAAPPAGPGVWPNGTHSEIVGDDFNAESYGLIDNYDGTNWLNMFDVQDVSDYTHRNYRRLILERYPTLHVCSEFDPPSGQY